jgi:hypothetical protein
MSIVSSNIVETVKNAFNFTVDKFPLSGPDKMKTAWYGLFRSDNQETVGDGSVTTRYVPHTTDDVLALVEASAEAFGGVGKVSCYFDHGHYLSIVPTIEHRKAIFGTADNVFPRMIVRAGYDGKCFNATMGYYRDLCKNMSCMRSVASSSVSIKHTSGLRGKMEMLIKQFGMLRQSWGEVTARIEQMQAETVNMADFLKAVYGQPETPVGRSATIHQNRTEAIINRLLNERAASGRPTMQRDHLVSKWEAFNAVQGYVQHSATRRGGEHGAFARAIFALNDPVVVKAENLLLGQQFALAA